MSSYAYSFAEGYTNTGFNEWLTLENPTNSTKKLFVMLVNGVGCVYYTQWIQISPSTRSTLNITALVLQHLVHAGDEGADYEVSIVVQSLNNTLFVAERPMYWNVVMGANFLTQGGTDIIGYTGLLRRRFLGWFIVTLCFVVS